VGIDAANTPRSASPSFSAVQQRLPAGAPSFAFFAKGGYLRTRRVPNPSHFRSLSAFPVCFSLPLDHSSRYIVWLHSERLPTTRLTDIQGTCIQITRYPIISPTLRKVRSCSRSFFRVTRNEFCRAFRMGSRTTSGTLCTGCNSGRLLPTGSLFTRWERAFTNCAKAMREHGTGYCAYDGKR